MKVAKADVISNLHSYKNDNILQRTTICLGESCEICVHGVKSFFLDCFSTSHFE